MIEAKETPTLWPRPTRYILVLLFLAAILWIVMAARPLFAALLVAVLLAYLLNPLVTILRQVLPVSRNAAVGIVYSLTLLFLFSLPALLLPSLRRQWDALRVYAGQLPSQLERFAKTEFMVLGYPVAIPFDPELLTQQALQLAANSTLDLINIVSSISTNLVWVLIALIATFYLLRDSEKLRNWLIEMFPASAQDDVTDIIDRIDLIWGRFLLGQTVLAVLMGILIGVIAALIGLPGALILGIVAGVLDLVPSLGPTVVGIVATLIALITGSSVLPVSNVAFSLIVVVIIIVLQNVENIWLRPQILGYTLNLHPAIVIIGVFGALATFGILGAIIVVPVMASIAVVWRYVHPRLVDVTALPNKSQTNPILTRKKEPSKKD